MSRRPRRLALGALGLVLAFLLSNCSADPLNVLVLNARAPGDKCAFDDPTLYRSGGSLDFRPWANAGGASGQSTSYYQVFSWENQMTPLPITVNGQVVDPGAGNDFIGDTVVYEYQYSGAGVTLSPETQNFRAVITAAGDSDKNSVGVQLIQPQAAAALDAALTANGTPQTLLVTFQIFGKTGAGVSKNTNKVSYPLTVYRSAPSQLVCDPSPTDGGVPTTVSTGACNSPGRDSPVHCINST